MRKLLTTLALVLLATVGFASPVAAEDAVAPVFDHRGAIDTDAVFVVFYYGSDTASIASMEHDGTDTITFLDSGAATDSFECPVSGALGGIIDTSNGSCNTLLEVLDIINDSGDWFAWPINGIASESVSTEILTQAAATAREDGMVVFFDDSENLTARAALYPGVNGNSSTTARGASVFNFAPGIRNGVLPVNPFAGQKTVLKRADVRTTEGGTEVDFSATCVVPNLNPSNKNYSETRTIMYIEGAPASTVIGSIDEFNYSGGGLVCEDGFIQLHYQTATNLTVKLISASGYSVQKSSSLPQSEGR